MRLSATAAAKIRIRPFRGALTSTAFHVRDEAAFDADAAVRRLRDSVELYSGQRPGDASRCFCLARRMAPPPPLIVSRQPGDAVIAEGGAWDPEIDDGDGWIALLQRHLAPTDALFVSEFDNPDSPQVDLLWVITADAARCSESAGKRH